MKKVMLVISILLLTITGCKRNINLPDNQTIVWKLLYDEDTLPYSHFVSEDSSITEYEIINKKPDDYNTLAVKEITCKKLFDASTQLKSCQTNDGLLVLAIPQELNVSLIKFDMSGKVVWERDVGVSGRVATEITLLDDGNIVFGVSDRLNSSSDSTSMPKGHVLCYSQKGKQQWQYTYEDNYLGRINYICQDDTRNLLCSGLVIRDDLPNLSTDIVITQLSPHGKLILETFFGGSKNESLESAVYSDRTGLIITGWTEFDDEDLTNGGKGATMHYIASVSETLAFNWVYNPETPLLYQHDQIQVQGRYISLSGFKTTENIDEITDDTKNIFCNYILDERGILIQEMEIENNSNPPLSAICLTKDQEVVFAFNTSKGSKIIIKNSLGETVRELACELTNTERVIPTADGGFIVKYKYPVKRIPTPAFVSYIWTDNATTLSCYDKNGQLVWQKTYDDYTDNILTDYLHVAF